MKKIIFLSFVLIWVAFSTVNAQSGCVGNASLTVVIEDCTDVEDIVSDAVINVFPNPFDEGFNLTLPNNLAAINCRIKVSDMSGRVLVDTESINQNTLYIPTAKLPSGMYLVSISGNGVSFERKVSKY